VTVFLAVEALVDVEATSLLDGDQFDTTYFFGTNEGATPGPIVA